MNEFPIYEFIRWLIMIISKILVVPFYLFPIKRNRIFFSSSGGRQYTDSPKSICEYLTENTSGTYEIIWAVRDVRKFEFLKTQEIKVVPFVSVQRIFYENTAKISIYNARFWFPFRKGQEHINTWHGGGSYKKVGFQEGGKNWFSVQNFSANRKNTSLFLSSSHFFTDLILRTDFDFQGVVLECGLPRNDVLIDCSDIKKRNIDGKVRQWLHISDDSNLILYAPTWRYDTDEKIPEININGVLQAYEERFHKKAVFLYRAHVFTTAPGLKNVINATQYPDMQELLLVCDMLISDYSSSIWDFSFTYKPCILYTPDLEKYRQERGFVKDISEWHFPFCTDNESLIRCIETFDEEKFVADMRLHHKDLGACETGEACKIVCDRIHDICFGSSKSEERE